jgi:hypothetical protein
MSYNLPQKFNEYKLPDEIKVAIQSKSLLLTENKAKMLLFAESNISNEDIDYWMAIKPKRDQDESFDDYKTRQKFQRNLIKYRPYIYQFN